MQADGAQREAFVTQNQSYAEGARKNECRPVGHLRFWRAHSFNGNAAEWAIPEHE